jgi:N-acetylmuramic acid 6-phosphate etherase
LGDEGSGYAVALAGLRAIARAADGRGPATALSSRFLARLRVNKVEALIPTLYSAEFTRADLAALASVVTDPALSGDPVAQNILDTAAEELADVAVAAARILLENASAAVPLALAGSLLLASAPFQDRLVTGLRRRGVSPDPIRHVCTPALGAIRLAREMLS